MGSKIEIIQGFLKEKNIGSWLLWRPDELVMTLGHLPHWGTTFAVITANHVQLFVPEMEPEESGFNQYDYQLYDLGKMNVDPWEDLYSKMDSFVDALDTNFNRVVSVMIESLVFELHGIYAGGYVNTYACVEHSSKFDCLSGGIDIIFENEFAKEILKILLNIILKVRNSIHKVFSTQLQELRLSSLFLQLLSLSHI